MPRLERAGTRRGQCVARDRQIVCAFELEGAEMRIAAHHHDLERAEIERRMRLLRHDRDPPREISSRDRSDLGAAS